MTNCKRVSGEQMEQRWPFGTERAGEEDELCERLQRLVRRLARENDKIAAMNKGAIRIDFAGPSMTIRVEEFLAEE